MMNPITTNIHKSWINALADEFKSDYFTSMLAQLQKEKDDGEIVYPPSELIFNAFNRTPFDKVKVVILGQDPYHKVGQAMGLSFSVPKTVKRPPSLLNIYKEINRDLGYAIPTHGDISPWADQGVLLLNAILTVREKSPGSHKQLGWQQFTDAVISKISAERENVVFLLWGNFAKSKKELIDESKHLVLESAHPSPMAGNAFQGNGHFSKSNEYLTQNGLKSVNWKISSDEATQLKLGLHEN